MPSDPNEHPCVAIKELKDTTNMRGPEKFESDVNTEVELLARLRTLNDPHLIKAIAYYEKEKRHFLMFPWARGGNLRDFWKKEPPKLDPLYTEWIFKELAGLARAIMLLHNYSEDSHWRHGDLKPENILCFQDGESYTLVIADVGLSREHDQVTAVRNDPTRTISGTVMYEPPESEIHASAARSRRYDIWSIGCIYLEFVIWLLYGAEGLRQLKHELGSTARDTSARFYVVDPSQEHGFQLNSVIQKWIERAQNDRRCPADTAVGHFINFIATRLLVAEGETDKVGMRRPNRKDSVQSRTDLEPGVAILVRSATAMSGTDDSSSFEPRATAEEMHKEMESILADAVSGSTEWLIWGAPVQEAPRRFPMSLAASDALAARGRNNREPEVRQRQSTRDSSAMY